MFAGLITRNSRITSESDNILKNDRILAVLFIGLLLVFWPAVPGTSSGPPAENILTPSNAIAQDRLPSIWDKHTVALVLGMGSGTALLLLTVALIAVNRSQKSALVRLRQAEESLREREERHRRLFETMTQGVIYQDADGAITFANPAAERILSLTMDQMRGTTSMDPRWKMIRPDGSEVTGTEHPAMIALRTGETVGPLVRGVFHPEKHAYVWLSITAIPLYRPDEAKPYEAYATFTDITRPKVLSDQLEERASVLEQRQTELETFRDAAVSRELEMIALKRRINNLSRQLGQAEPFDLSFADALGEDQLS